MDAIEVVHMSACPHGMPTPGSCIDCMDEGLLPPPPRPAKPKREGWPFTAQHTSVCKGCTDEVRPGDRIVRMDDDTYRHVGDCEKA